MAMCKKEQGTNFDLVGALVDTNNKQSYRLGQALGIIEQLLNELSANNVKRNSNIDHSINFYNANNSFGVKYDYKK